MYERTENALVYSHKINGVDCLLIYTFKDNKLRTAGYVTQTPVMNAEHIITKLWTIFFKNTHIAPLGLAWCRVWRFYKHIAPLGLAFGASEFIFSELGMCENPREKSDIP